VGSVTYAELQVQTERVAAALAEIGVGDGARVGLHVERSCASVAAMLGILARGRRRRAHAPSYPGRRLDEILKFGRLNAVIASADTHITRRTVRPC
jgi:non-ribosomal peptide synthetase component F